MTKELNRKLHCGQVHSISQAIYLIQKLENNDEMPTAAAEALLDLMQGLRDQAVATGQLLRKLTNCTIVELSEKTIEKLDEAEDKPLNQF